MASKGPLWTVATLLAAICSAQTTGTVSGTVVLESTNGPMHSAHLLLSPLGRSVTTDENGKYEFRDVPPGSYSLTVRSSGLSDDRKTIQLSAGGSEVVDFKLRLAAVRESVTVSATGQEQSALDLVQPVADLGQLQLPLRTAGSLGEVLQNEAGVTKRSSGPGSSRPVVRGFDGDRVMILEDGISTGTLSYQSGDHGEPMDVNKLERLEVVRGPATLLYGSSAIGGVVNAISRHEILHEHPHEGIRGYLTGVAGSNSGLGGGTGGFEFGTRNWEIWGSGGGQRTGEYNTPLGTVGNSQTRMEQTDAGFGRFSAKGFFSVNYGFTDSKYGIPEDPNQAEQENANMLMRKHNYRFTTGVKFKGAIENALFRLNYSDYNHQELVGGVPETNFFNKQFTYRAVFDQRKNGPLSGSFGFSGLRRDYKTEGEELVAPPTILNGISVFALESLDLESTRLQFGGRIENNRYKPRGLENRSFTGFSGAMGLSRRLTRNATFALNYSHSYRAPSLEELYNNGPHPGNLTFEIGSSNLASEKNNGLDVSLRHQSSRLRAEANFFYYHISNFIYLAPTGAFRDGLREAEYFQQDSRYTGGEARVDLGLHPNFWINLGADAVNARITSSKTYLPRIPPVRGRVGFDARYKGFSLQPELVLSKAQTNLFPTETQTAGYALVNLTGSYTIAGSHRLHVLAVELFNAGDRLYRNHLSFIKEFAPEIGRGLRVSYTVQFF